MGACEMQEGVEATGQLIVARFLAAAQDGVRNDSQWVLVLPMCLLGPGRFT